MVQIIGHRGARGIEPENTIRSYKKALELGVDYIECDVHMTKDGHIVLMHVLPPDLPRMSREMRNVKKDHPSATMFRKAMERTVFE